MDKTERGDRDREIIHRILMHNARIERKRELDITPSYATPQQNQCPTSYHLASFHYIFGKENYVIYIMYSLINRIIMYVYLTILKSYQSSTQSILLQVRANLFNKHVWWTMTVFHLRELLLLCLHSLRNFEHAVVFEV